MSCVFSTRFPMPISCDQPQFTVNFPVFPAAANTVTLANGAVVDLAELGRIIARTCPPFVCEANVVQVVSTQAPIGTGQTVSVAIPQ